MSALHFAFYVDASGEISLWGMCGQDDAVALAPPAGQTAYCPGSGGPWTASTHYFSAGSPVAYSAPEAAAKAERPSWRGTWSNATMAWVDGRVLADSKALKRLQINAWRLAANRSTFNYGGKTFACDELSRSDIDGVQGRVARLGALPAWFPGAWKAVDNTFLSIPDVATWDAFYDAMCLQGAINFLHSEALKSLVSAAVTNAGVEAITWETPT